MDCHHTRFTLLAAALVLALGACHRSDDGDKATAEAAPPPIDESLAGAPPETAPAVAASASAPLPAADATAAHFARLDLDGNGVVTADEHVQASATMFKAMDADGDGRVTAAEMDAAQAALGGDARMSSADKIRAIDGNGDGVLTAEEHADGSRTMFATMDTDGDGRLDLAEVTAGHDALIGQGQALGGVDSGATSDTAKGGDRDHD